MSKLSADLIKAVHTVEDKYGRTSNAPYGCPELQACHQIVLKMAGSPEGDVHRQIIVIRRLMKRELTHEAIALKLGLSLSTVNKRIRQIGAGEGHEIAGN
ncbi:MAG: hypothetical protein LIV28_09700 [Lactobacillus sp.]|nr:hypothetical protein [Lactobacillus sp.]